MNIAPVKLSKNYFLQRNFLINPFNNPYNNSSFKVNGTKLAPLNADTVSFSSRLDDAVQNPKLCNEIHDEAFYAQKYLTAVTRKYFGEQTIYKKDDKGKIYLANPAAPLEKKKQE